MSKILETLEVFNRPSKEVRGQPRKLRCLTPLQAAKELKISEGAAFHRLRRYAQRGLLRATRVGKRIAYRISADGIIALKEASTESESTPVLELTILWGSSSEPLTVPIFAADTENSKIYEINLDPSKGGLPLFSLVSVKDRLVGLQEAGKILNYTTRRLHTFVQTGRLKPFASNRRGKPLFSVSMLKKFKKKHEKWRHDLRTRKYVAN